MRSLQKSNPHAIDGFAGSEISAQLGRETGNAYNVNAGLNRRPIQPSES
jgi:hypothetical protein